METDTKKGMEQVTDSKKPVRYSKLLLAISTMLVGIIATGLAAWFQLNVTEEQAREAEIEREKSIRKTIVSIIEEHILNGRNLDISRIARLTEHLKKEDGLRKPIPVIELIEKAEFNIINSRYLDSEVKQKYKEVFDGIYRSWYQASDIKYKGKHINLVDDLTSSIQTGQTAEIVTKLNRLLVAFNADIKDWESQSQPEKSSLKDVMRIVIKKPYLISLLAIIYVLIAVSFFTFRRKRLRRMDLLRRGAMAEEYFDKAFSDIKLKSKVEN